MNIYCLFMIIIIIWFFIMAHFTREDNTLMCAIVTIVLVLVLYFLYSHTISSGNIITLHTTETIHKIDNVTQYGDFNEVSLNINYKNSLNEDISVNISSYKQINKFKLDLNDETYTFKRNSENGNTLKTTITDYKYHWGFFYLDKTEKIAVLE